MTVEVGVQTRSLLAEEMEPVDQPESTSTLVSEKRPLETSSEEVSEE